MPTDDLVGKDVHPMNKAGDLFVSAVKAVATAFFAVLGWIVGWLFQGIRWLARRFYAWFTNLNGTGKTLFSLNIVLLVVVIYLWLDLDIWYMFYGQE
jgi:hypothetical protein